jgi:hypothetical protein
MINISRTGTKVIVSIEGGPLNATYNFSYDCGNEHYAHLLSTHFDKVLSDRIELVRSKEYQAGYNDHKKRKSKRDYHFITLTKEVPS